MSIESDAFFDGDGILAENEEIRLRKPIESDREACLAACRENSFDESAFDAEGVADGIWGRFLDPRGLCCVVESRADGAFLGHCEVKRIGAELPEVGIELLRGAQGKGIGGQALRLLMAGYSGTVECVAFRARVDPLNFASQKMLEGLGAKPKGISRSFFFPDDERARLFEEENLGAIDEKLAAVAKTFDVEPRRLLSSVLEYRIPPRPR